MKQTLSPMIKFAMISIFSVAGSSFAYTLGGDGGDPQKVSIQDASRADNSGRGGDGSDPRGPGPIRGGDGSDPRGH